MTIARAAKTSLPLRAIIYVRQSQDVEGARAAVDRQLAECEALCRRLGWTVVRVIIDNDVSASGRKKREGYAKLFREVEAGACDVIVAWAQDRLLRNVRDGEGLIELVEKNGVKIATVQGGEHDLSTSDGRLHVRMLAVIAKAEMEKKAARQRLQQQQAATNGLPPDRRLFGYGVPFVENGKKKIRDRDQFNPDEKPVVRECFDRLLAGDSLRSIHRYLVSTGLPTTLGNPWRRDAVRQMLLNSRYAAVRTYYGEDPVPAKWPAIITVEECEKAKLILEEPMRLTNTDGSARKWLGPGLFRCWKCGGPVVTGYREGVRTYMCAPHKHVTRVAEPIDDYVTRVVEARLRQDDAADLLAGSSADLKPLRAEAAEIRRKIDRAVRDYDDEVIDGATLKAVKTRRTAELKVIERKIAAATRDDTLARLGSAPDPVEAFRRADLRIRREIVDVLMTVTLLAGKPGRKPFDPETVRIDWK